MTRNAIVPTRSAVTTVVTPIETTIALPRGFNSVDDQLPAEDKPVLAIKLSGYTCCQFEVMTARYQPTYRPLDPWRDLSGDHISGDILGWRYADELLKGLPPSP